MEIEYESKLSKINEFLKGDLENLKEVVINVPKKASLVDQVNELFSDILDA